MLKKLLTLTLTCTLILSSATFAFAEGNSRGKGNLKKIKTNQENILTEIQENEDQVLEDEVNGQGKRIHAWKELRNKLEQEKDVVEAEKDEIEAQKDELEKQYEEAVNAENSELAEELKQQIEELKVQTEELKQDMKNIRLRRKEVIRNKYSEEELTKIEEAKEALLEAGEDIKVLDVDCILSKKADIKFDTPPVIKGSRTLIPVRAIVEGFGADVEWDGETREVTITKGDIVILLPLDSNEVYVNGEQVLLDTRSEVMNSRTYVPLRFIVETFGLNVEWDGETETIELEEDEEEIAEDETDEEIIEEVDEEIIEEVDEDTNDEESDVIVEEDEDTVNEETDGVIEEDTLNPDEEVIEEIVDQDDEVTTEDPTEEVPQEDTTEPIN